MNWESLVRPQIAGFEPYIPGRSMESVRRERGLKRIIKLASNENPLGPSMRAIRAMNAVGKLLFRYPDGASTDLRAALAKHWRIPINDVIVGAGSDEVIELLGKTFLNRGDSIVVSEHAFTRYKMAADLMGAETVTVPMTNLKHDLPRMAQAVRPDTKLVFIANPNNPTGTYNSAIELEDFLIQLAQLNANRPQPVIAVVDEAYYEFASVLAKDYPDTMALRKQFPFLLVTRTYSKAHGLAGLRIGYGIGEARLIQAMDRVRPPFNINLAAQAAGVASLTDAAHIRRSVRLVATEAKKMRAALQRIGVPFVPSIGNFVLLNLGQRLGRDVFEKLLDRGIITRSMDEYGLPHHLRVTYGLANENRLFIKALTEVLGS
jgi:histidinol-phosphate aminotransferase